VTFRYRSGLEVIQLATAFTIETEPDGWFSRTPSGRCAYSISAVLLDLDDPTKMIAR